MKYKVSNIQYDTDGLNVKLPNQYVFEVNDPEFQPEYELADMISDECGWCVVGFHYELLGS